MKKSTAKELNPNIHPIKLKPDCRSRFFLTYSGDNFPETLAMAPDTTSQVYVLKWDPAIGHYDRKQFELTTSKIQVKDIEKVLNDISTVPDLNPENIWSCKLKTIKFCNNIIGQFINLLFGLLIMMKITSFALSSEWPMLAQWVDNSWIIGGVYGIGLLFAKSILSYMLNKFVSEALNNRMGLVAKKLKKWNQVFKPQGATWVRGTLAAWLELHIAETGYDIRGYDYPDMQPEIENKGCDYPELDAPEDQTRERFAK